MTTKSRMVRYTLDTLPPLTERDHTDLKALAERPDSEIDFSDIPELTAEQIKRGRRGVFSRPRQEITARVEADVFDWLNTLGGDYRLHVSYILRNAMLDAQEAAKDLATRDTVADAATASPAIQENAAVEDAAAQNTSTQSAPGSLAHDAAA